MYIYNVHAEVGQEHVHFLFVGQFAMLKAYFHENIMLKSIQSIIFKRMKQ